MLLLPTSAVFDELAAQSELMRDMQYPRMRSGRLLAVPSVDWFHGLWAAQWQQHRTAYGITPFKIRGRPVCDVISRAASGLMGLNLLATPAAWESGQDVSISLFNWRVLLLADTDYLGVSTPQAGGHDTGLMVVHDGPQVQLLHYEMQTGRDCPIGESFARGLTPVELRD